MRSLVSICIPAWERPVLILETVQSCLAQTYEAIEVLITDDSRSDRVERALAAFWSDPRIRYVRNPVRLGQAGNVNKLFELARGDRLVLLHDDDVLLPDALAVLDAGWRQAPDTIACYGKIRFISDSGEALDAVTERACQTNHRHSAHAGVQVEKLWSALVQQLPSDGYMIRSDVARETRYREYSVIGDACDYDFSLRMAGGPGSFCYVDEYVSKYRLTCISVTTTSNAMDLLFLAIEALEVPPQLERLKKDLLRRRVMSTVRSFLRTGQARRARDLMLDPRYVKMNFSVAGVTNLLFFLPPPVWQRLRMLRRSSAMTRVSTMVRSMALRARLNERA